MLLAYELRHAPVFKATIWEEPSDDKWNFFLGELLDGNLQGICLPFGIHQDGCIHTVINIRQERVFIVYACFPGWVSSPYLQCPGSQHPCSLVLGHVWCRHALCIGLFHARIGIGLSLGLRVSCRVILHGIRFCIAIDLRLRFLVRIVVFLESRSKQRAHVKGVKTLEC